MKNLTLLLFILSLALKLSAQSSITWDSPIDIAANSYGNMHPRMSLDANGNPLVIWGRSSDKSVFISRWNGTMFTSPVKLNGTLTVASATWMGPDIGSHGDTVYVVMKQTPESDTSSHIYIVRSFNGGITFSSPLRVEYIADNHSRFPTVTTDDIGNPIVAFMKSNNSSINTRWVVTKSSDFGNTFSADVKASGWGGSTEVCNCCPGAIISEGNESAMLYRDENNNIRDIFMGVSSDNNTSFTNGYNIDNNNWLLMNCPSSGPDGVIMGDTVYSVFMNGASGNPRVYFSKASLSSIAVSSVQPITGSILGLSQQNYPRIENNGHEAAMVWKQLVSGNTQLNLLFTNDIRNGFSTNYDTVALNNITNADVSIKNGKVFVIWEDNNSQTVKYRSGSYTTGTAGTNEITKNNVSIFPNPVSETLYLNFQNEVSLAQITLLDVSGKTILKRNINNTSNTTINTDVFTNGIYFIQIKSNQGILTKKIIINN